MSSKYKYGWRGKTVRHIDGRTGVIIREAQTFSWLELTIAVDDAHATESVTLSAHGSGFGAKGWAWFCPEFSGGPAYLPLGDHSDVQLQRVEPAKKAGVLSG